MIRKQTAVLEVNAVTYVDGKGRYANLPLAIPDQKQRIDALTTCTRDGWFSVEGYKGRTKYQNVSPCRGRIIKIEFLGKRKLTRPEIKDIDIKLDENFTVECVSYSFKQWQREGRPLMVRLARREEYFST